MEDQRNGDSLAPLPWKPDTPGHRIPIPATNLPRPMSASLSQAQSLPLSIRVSLWMLC
jgi:hypothetical protein